jgi:hypothetical protein
VYSALQRIKLPFRDDKKFDEDDVAAHMQMRLPARQSHIGPLVEPNMLIRFHIVGKPEVI